MPLDGRRPVVRLMRGLLRLRPAPGRGPRGCRRRPRARPNAGSGRAATPAAASCSSDSCWWVVEAGWMTSVRASPMFARWLTQLAPISMNASPAARPPVDAEREHRARPLRAGSAPPGRGAGAIGQSGVAHPGHPRVGLQPLGDRAGVGDVRVHPLRQRLDALQQQESANGATAPAPMSRSCSARSRVQKRVLAEVLPVPQPAVAGDGLGHPREAARCPSRTARTRRPRRRASCRGRR